MRPFTIRMKPDEHGVLRVQILCGRRWRVLLVVNDLLTAGELVR